MNIRAAINYEKVPPVPYYKTVSLVNNVVIETTEFLNRFSYLCEQKLLGVSRDIQRLEVTLAILEAKLASIPDLEGVTVSRESVPSILSGASESASAAPPPPDASGAPPPPPPPGSGAPPPPPPPPGSGAPPPPPPSSAGASPVPVAEEAPAVTDGPTVQNDPRYAKYFKMVRMGVNEMQVRQKMQIEGHDPSLLDNPDAPAPPGGEPEQDSDDEDFDDDDF